MKLSFWSLKQWLEFGVMFVAVVVLVWFGGQYHGQLESHQIQGQLKIVSQFSLDVTGTHILDTYPDNSDYAHPQSFVVKITPDTKYSGGLTNEAGLQQGMWITIKTANNSIDQKTIIASEISKATEYSLSGKVTAITDRTITISTIRVVAGDSGNYTTPESKRVIVNSNTPVVLLSLKNNKVTRVKSSINAIKAGSTISVLTNTPPDSGIQLTPTSIQISE